MKYLTTHKLLLIGLFICAILVISLAGFILFQEFNSRKVNETITRNVDKYELLNVPNAPKDEKTQDELNARIIEASQKGTQISLKSGCEAEPLVLQARLNSEVSVTNESDVAFVVVLNEKEMTIEPKKSESIKINFPQGTGIYGYRCTITTDTPVNGYIYVTP